MIKSRFSKEKLEIIAKMRGKKPHEMFQFSDKKIKQIFLILDKKNKK